MTVINFSYDKPTLDVANFSLESIKTAHSMMRKSPLIAASLSSVVPGLGQLYSGHWFDALQAFAMVSVSAFSTFGFYSYEIENSQSHVPSGIMALITLFLHSSNIFGAYKTASYYNEKKNEDFLSPLRAKIFALPTIGMNLIQFSIQ